MHGLFISLAAGLPASPPLRQYFKLDAVDPKRPLRLRITNDQSVKVRSSQAEGVRAITNFLRPDSIAQYTAAVIAHELQRCFQTTKSDNDLGEWAISRIGDFSLVADIAHLLSVHLPRLDSTNEKELGTDEELQALGLPTDGADSVLFEKIFDGIKKLNLLPFIMPFHQKLQYPVDQGSKSNKRRIRRNSEQNLDNFWQRIDEATNKEHKSSLLDITKRCCRWSHEIRRSLLEEDVMSPKATDARINVPGPISTASYPSNLPSDTVMPFRPAAVKVQTKTHGIPSVTAPSPPPPQPEQEQEPQEGANQKIYVSSKNLEVFQKLGFNLGPEARSGQLKWNDFCSAMEQIGFAVTPVHGGGSAYHFVPAAKLKLDGPISFHRPHPSAVSERNQPRRMGKRLRTRYQWGADVFFTGDA